MSGNEICQSPGCSEPGLMKCPICLKNGTSSFFCSQECFKRNYSDHKVVHSTFASSAANCSGSAGFDPWPGYRFSGSLRPFPVTAMRSIPRSISRPGYADRADGVCQSERVEKRTSSIVTLSEQEIEGVRRAGRLGREVLDLAIAACGVGVTTEHIDKVVHDACIERKCYPSPLNYHKFPKSCCTSVNEVICHGIPDQRPLCDGDILNIDVTVFHDGFHGDLNETVFIGTPDQKSIDLVRTTYECLDLAIAACRPGLRYRDVGAIIQKHASRNGFSVVRSYCGHGIHRLFHCNPCVPHYARNRAVGLMKEGHVFTIEPMINMGGYGDNLWPDGWTAVTQDGKRSAQFEHTLVITKNGCEVLTARTEGNPNQPWFVDQLNQRLTS